MRHRRSALEDLMLQATRMPWWAGVAFALVSWVVLRVLAGRYATPVRATSLGDMSTVVVRTLVGTAAQLLQLVIPLMLLLGAGVSAWRKSRASTLFERGRAGGGAAVAAMSWNEFERLVAEAFRRQGYSVSENIVGGTDGGVDLVLDKDARRYLVQCKHWRAQSVGVSVVRELKGVVAVRGAVGGFVVTSGTFTPEAVAFGAHASIDLLDGRRLRMMIDGSEFHRIASRTTQGEITAGRQAPTPACPTCGGSMVVRTARRGANIGGQFWGCKAFPRCKGTTSLGP